MLQFIRNRAQTFLVKGILWLIILAFVGTIFLVWGRGSEKANAVVAKVGGMRITRAEYLQAYRQYEDLYRRQLGDAFSYDFMRNLNLEQIALDSLVTRNLQLNQARKDKIRISDDELAQAIYQNPNFQTDGRFDQDLYRRILTANRLKPTEYENAVRTDLTLDKLARIVKEGIQLTQEEIREKFFREKIKVQARYLILPPAIYRDRVQLSEENTRKYYEDHSQNFRTAEKRIAELILADTEHFKDQVTIDDNRLNEYYQENQEEFSTPEKVRASHILVQLDEGAAESETEQAEMKLKTILRELDSGSSFEEVAKKYSDDPGSKEIGGELGYFTQGQMVPQFEETAFGLDPGEMAREVRSSFGFHVIKVTDRVPPSIKSFDAAKTDIENQLIQSGAEELAQKKLDEILDRSDQRGGNWQDSIQQMPGISVREVTVKRGEPILGMEGSDSLVQEIFNLSEGSVGTVQPIGTEFAVSKLVRIIEPVVPLFEEIRTKVEEKYIDDETEKILNTESARNLDRLQSGTSMEEISKELGLEIKDTGLIQRDDFLQDVPSFNNIRNAAFTMKVNEYKNVEADKFQVLLQVEKMELSTESEYQEEKEEYTKQALNERREMAYQEWLKALRDRAEKKNQIFIDRDLL